MALTSKSLKEMHLEMARMIRDKAREEGLHKIANLDLEAIVELHKQVMESMGYVPKKLPH